MRAISVFAFIGIYLFVPNVRAEDAAELETQGIAALKLSQTDSDAIVSAAIYFGKAASLYDQANNDDKASEMNSFLYWCKKKMTLRQTEAFLNRSDAAAASIALRMKELEATALVARWTRKLFYERADASYAKGARQRKTADRDSLFRIGRPL